MARPDNLKIIIRPSRTPSPYSSDSEGIRAWEIDKIHYSKTVLFALNITHTIIDLYHILAPNSCSHLANSLIGTFPTPSFLSLTFPCPYDPENQRNVFLEFSGIIGTCEFIQTVIPMKKNITAQDHSLISRYRPDPEGVPARPLPHPYKL